MQLPQISERLQIFNSIDMVETENQTSNLVELFVESNLTDVVVAQIHLVYFRRILLASSSYYWFPIHYSKLLSIHLYWYPMPTQPHYIVLIIWFRFKSFFLFSLLQLPRTPSSFRLEMWNWDLLRWTCLEIERMITIRRDLWEACFCFPIKSDSSDYSGPTQPNKTDISFKKHPLKMSSTYSSKIPHLIHKIRSKYYTPFCQI